MCSLYLHNRSTFPVWLLFFALITVSFGQRNPGPSNIRAIHYSGRILDRRTEKPIGAARIRIIPALGRYEWRTDSNGRFSFWTADEKAQGIKIEREGYGAVSLLVKGCNLQDIRLEPISSISSSPIELTASDKTSRLMPPSQAVAPAIVTADSGPKMSGEGKNWSGWYRLGVGKAPGGYTVQRVEFWLSGDRTCGFSAECRELTRNDQQVLWEFRLQGHDEIGAPAKTASVAHIRAIYRVQ